MIEIRSREEAERELGKYGARLWGEKVRDVSFSYQAYRFISKPEPLSDEEALAVYWTGNSIEPALRAVINAHEAREREIARAECDDDLVDMVADAIDSGRKPHGAGRILTCRSRLR